MKLPVPRRVVLIARPTAISVLFIRGQLFIHLHTLTQTHSHKCIESSQQASSSNWIQSTVGTVCSAVTKRTIIIKNGLAVPFPLFFFAFSFLFLFLATAFIITHICTYIFFTSSLSRSLTLANTTTTSKQTSRIRWLRRWFAKLCRLLEQHRRCERLLAIKSRGSWRQ